MTFVGGYKADEVVERYPEVHMAFNRDWAHTGPARSLGLAPVDPDGRTFVCYSDVVFRRAAVSALRDAVGDVVIAVDTTWRARYDARSRRRPRPRREGASRVARWSLDVGPGVDTDAADAEFAGAAAPERPRAGIAFAAARSGALAPTATLPELLRYLLDRGLEVTAVDLVGEWAELDAKQDLARFVLGTKAESLERLRKMNHGGEIGALVSFTYGDWLVDRAAVIDQVLADVPGDRLIVRSSALLEDSWFESRAGRHDSVLDVARTPDAIGAAVDQVFASYGSDDAGNQVLVQEMLDDVALSGVVMTRQHALGAPYYVVNFDDTTARTDTVTGGGDARSVFLHRGSALRSRARPAARRRAPRRAEHRAAGRPRLARHRVRGDARRRGARAPGPPDRGHARARADRRRRRGRARWPTRAASSRERVAPSPDAGGRARRATA